MSENSNLLSGDGLGSAVDPIFADWEKENYEHALRVAELLKPNKVVLFGAMEVAGITHITIEFNGYGDEGQMEDARAYAEGTEIAMPEDRIEILDAMWGSRDTERQTVMIGEAVTSIAWAILGRLYGGWQDNDGAFGEFKFDVATATITLDFNERYTDSTNYTHEF
ncbi:DUF6878 family protein [Acidocella facilis]|uniref:DUF6878 family protein n=1 Tax=Acidocella facilis TaxID=525 RepID=UPI001F4518CD|nr:DUF6878 family protein [Acidocella facilis]